MNILGKIKSSYLFTIRRLPSRIATLSTSQRDDTPMPWLPKKRLTREQMEHLRFLAKNSSYNVSQLSHQFGISPEAVKRILKSNFQPSVDILNRQELNKKRWRDMKKRSL